MLPSEQRLNLAQAKWRYRYSDREFSTKLFKILVKKNKLAASRFGFLLTGKLGKASKRNLAKRRLTEAVQEKIGDLPSGFDFIFIGYPTIIESSYEEIRTSLHQVLPKISLL
ncbi:MAG: ribonuclease P protein component [bacterium]|nr:ribonuclease P protein component [bacterium]